MSLRRTALRSPSPSIRRAAFDLTPEEEAQVMWDRTYEGRVRRLLEGVERAEVAAYEDLCRGFVDEYQALVHHWLFDRKGNMGGTIGDEAPEFGGARDALHFRYRKMEVELRELRARQAKALADRPFPGEKMLAALGREIDAFESAFAER